MKVQPISSIVVFAALALAGCGQPPDATFEPNHEKVGPLLRDARDMVATALVDNFGTPNKLVAWEKFKIDFGKAEPQADEEHKHRLKPGWRLVEGHKLYMQHCLHCHGTAGDGNGPTARFLSPRPRDYRQGIFKFKSTIRGLKPSQHDLVHILEQGIPGTYMPSFVLLGPEKLRSIVDYVRWLSIRGNFEIRLAEELAGAGATEADVKQSIQNDETKKLQMKEAVEAAMNAVKGDLAQLIEDVASELAEKWEAGDLPESVIVPKIKQQPSHQRIDRKGPLAVFCRSILIRSMSRIPRRRRNAPGECHGRAGRGDGPNTEKFWEVPKSNPKRFYETAGLHDDWGHPQKPRDLTRGLYRGGRRPIDIFRRVHQGIPGTQMAGFGAALSEDEIWDVVNFVLSVPFEGKHSAYPTEIEDQKQADQKEVAAAEE